MGEAKRRREQFRKVIPPCVFCGVEPGTTDDHVPAKCLFVPPRPQLIIVPACRSCNGSISALEEQFRVFLGVKMGIETPASVDFWKMGGLRSVGKNRRLHRELLSGAPLWIRSPTTGHFEPTRTFKWPSSIHNSVIAKITRGLYYHHFKTALSPTTTLQVGFLDRFPIEIRDLAMGNDFHRRHLGGDDRFCYAFNRCTEDPEISIWVFQFYKRHWATALTKPEALDTAAVDGKGFALAGPSRPRGDG
jgi:hypothetical protein